MATFFEVAAAARKAGLSVTQHHSGIPQIDGHAWFRWADLHDKPDPVIVRPGINGGGSKVSAA